MPFNCRIKCKAQSPRGALVTPFMSKQQFAFDGILQDKQLAFDINKEKGQLSVLGI
jgi:hypothetical protein